MAKKPNPKKNELKGSQLNLAASIYLQYGDDIVSVIDRMTKDVKKELRALFETHAADYAMDASIASQARIAMNALLDRWVPIFGKAAKIATQRMIKRVEKNATATLGMSLKEISSTLAVKPVITPEIEEIMKASTLEAANLIKTLPEQYLADVQGQVMRSITTGRGLQDLVPFLNIKYKQNIRKARNVAQDQTRKAYTSLQANRMQALGIKKFEWIHSSAGKEPRPLHVQLSGKIFDFDAPPFIGVMYGRDVYGMPGELPNCRCTLRPVISFEED